MEPNIPSTPQTTSPQPLDRSPIFIGGLHRSGTTLLRVMLHRHPHIACGPESQLLDVTEFEQFHDYLSSTWMPLLEPFGLTTADLDGAMAAFMDNFFSRYAAQRNKQRWGEKTPMNILHIDYLFRLFPRARFIHMIRDPRDIHCSVVEKARTTTPRWERMTPKRTARGWVRAIEHGRPWRAAPDRYLELRYEDLARQPVEAMQRVLAFLNEPWSDAVLEPQAAKPVFARGNVNQQVFSTSIGRWRRDLSPADVEVIEQFAGEYMPEFGYEPAGEVLPARSQEESSA